MDEDLAALAVDAVFDAFGVDALYLPPVGAVPAPPRACRALHDRRDRAAEAGASVVVAAGHVIELRRQEVAAPVKGGRIVVGDAQFVIVSHPRSDDSERLVWRCTVAPQ